MAAARLLHEPSIFLSVRKYQRRPAAVGTFVDPTTDNNETLILRGTGDHWTVDQGPNPGSGSNILGGLTAIGGHLWAAGTFDDGGSRLPLVEHR